jgi:predicted tellurium resistance membrane protein TerC
VAVFVLALQLLSMLITPLGEAIRSLPVVPVALILVTVFIGVQLIRSR